MLHTAIYTRTSEELEHDLRRKIEARGDVVVGVFSDRNLTGQRGRNSGWNSLLTLDGVDQIAVASAGDLPCRTVSDLLRLLANLRDHDVGLILVAEGIDTTTAFAVLDAIEAFRRAKLSQAIQTGQAKARAAGKLIGRPQVPGNIRRQIEVALARGSGVRPTARKYGVSAATVSALKKSMAATPDKLAA